MAAPMKIYIHTDGASRGNPGLASYGFVVEDDQGRILYEEGKYIGLTTNNVAEYTGILEALKLVKSEFKGKEIEVHLLADSKLAIEQLSGRYKIKSPHLKLIIEEIKILAINLGGVSYMHVPREKNKIADKLANLAIDRRPRTQ